MTATTDAPPEAKALPRYLLVWAVCLALLPAGMGVFFIVAEIYLADRPRIHWFVGLWTGLGALTVLAALPSGFRPIRALISRSSLVNSALIIFLAVVAASLFGDTSGFMMKPVRNVVLILVIIAGCAAYHLTRRWGTTFAQFLIAALIAGPLLHIPVLVWLVQIQGQNPDFEWNFQLAGFTGVRPYSYTVEVAIALGLGRVAAIDRTRPLALFGGIALLSVLWAALFWSGGRGAALGLLGGLIVVTLVWRARALRLWFLGLLTAATGAILSLQVWTPPHGAFGLINVASRSVGNNPTSDRTDLWQAGLEAILANPILGYGFAHPMAWGHLHNLPLNLLHAFGVVGSLAVVILLMSLLQPLITARGALRTPVAQALLLALFALLAHGLVSGTYFHVHGQLYQALVAGTLLAVAAGTGTSWQQPGR